MKNNFSIFYSWQSDIKVNRNFILNCIEKAIKEIKKKHNATLSLEINIDRDTKNNSGSPSISDTIFRKIEICDIFICDVTIVNKTLLTSLFGGRISPNPNVLVEMGYAVHVLGWDRVICIANLEFSKIEELPFDIRGHRISTFIKTDNDSKKQFSSLLSNAIESIVLNYDKILSDQATNSHKVHDLNIYNDILNICKEEILFDSISVVVNDLFTRQYYLDIWDNLQEFYKKTINRFIDEDLSESLAAFLKELNEFDNIVSVKFHMDDRNDPTYRKYLSRTVDGDKLTEEEEFDYKQIKTYSPHKDPFPNETWPDSDKRIHRLQDELYDQGEKVKSSHRTFVMNIKRKLL